METVKYCKRCVQANTRPDLVFEEGVCLPCKAAEANDSEKIDWEARKKELYKIVEWGKQHSKLGYDCIIGVSGGKDSTRQALLARDELNLKPLLVSCTYPPEQLTERGAHNLGNLIRLGFDTITVSPNPKVWKYMMRKGFLKFGNWCKSTEMALKATLPRMAIAYNIPLILVGENPALTTGDWAGSLGGDGNQWQYSHTLRGGPQSLLDEDDEISESDLYWYNYPTDEEMQRANLRVVFLGYYFESFNGPENARIAIDNGLQIRTDPPEDTGNIVQYDQLDDDFVIVNQMLKYLKFGFGKVTDHACEVIRLDKMTREEGIELVKKYDGKCAYRFIERFYKYLKISEDEFWEVAESHRGQIAWEKDKKGRWRLKNPIWKDGIDPT